MNVVGSQVQSSPTVNAKPLSSFHIGVNPDLPDPLRLRYFLLGMPGSGKTAYVASIPNSIHIDPEDQRQFEYRGVSDVFVPRNGEELSSFIESLIADKAKKYRHVIIDTLDKTFQMLIPWITESYNRTHRTSPVADIREALGGKGGWGKVNDYINSIPQRLYEAGYGWTIAAHVKEDRRENNGVVSIVPRPRINDGIYGVIGADAQYIMQAHLISSSQMAVFKDAKGNEVQGGAVQVRQQLIEIKSPVNNTVSTRYLKERLGEFMPESFTVGRDEAGWQKWAVIYKDACEKAKSKRP